MAEKKFAIIRVTMTKDYAVALVDDSRTEINGWTVKQVINDWFKGDYDLNRFHATREAYELGSSTRFVKADVVSEEMLKQGPTWQYIKERMKYRDAPPEVQRLIDAAKDAVIAMKSESSQWQGEGYQGDYSEDEIKRLEAALKPFFDDSPGGRT